MRTATYRWVVGVVGVMVLGSVAGAQSAESACSEGFQNTISYGQFGKSSVAYMATAKTSFEQKLPDGSYVRGFAVTHQARDGTGRTMSEFPQACRRDENGVFRPDLNVIVFDPATKATLNWQVGNPYPDKVAHLIHQSPPKPLTSEQLALQRRLAAADETQKEYKTEDLGTRTIAGVEAHGSRTTQTIPAGEQGNELPLVVKRELWRSKELGLVMLGIMDDPRRGKTTFEIEDLTPGEPDPALFVPPAG